MDIDNSQTTFFEKAQRLLWFFAGVDAKYLKGSTSEYAKYSSLGAIVLFTALLAGLSAGYAFFTVFKSLPVSFFVFFFWGSFILTIDRFMVTSLKKSSNWKKDLLPAIPRIIFAILLGLVMSNPLELKIFESEVNAQLEFDKLTYVNELDGKLKSEYKKIEDLKRENEIIKNDLNKKVSHVVGLEDAAIKEADGSGGTERRGIAQVYRLKQQRGRMARLEYEELKYDQEISLRFNNEKINDLQNQITKTRNLNIMKNSSADGILARNKALENLKKRDPIVWYVDLFIKLLITFIEVAPVLTKLLSPRGRYDIVLQDRDKGFAIQSSHVLTENKKELESQARLKTNRDKFLLEGEINESKKQLAIKTIRDETDIEMVKNLKEKILNKSDEALDERAKEYLNNWKP